MREHIHQSNLIEGYDSVEHDATSDVAWGYLVRQEKLTHEVIKNVQMIIVAPQELDILEVAEYRDTTKRNATVGNQAAPLWPMVKGLMDNWLLDYKKMTPKQAHIRFEKIHPFCDGNGRTGRMLMWWQQIKIGEEPLLLVAKDKEEYYKWFR